MITVRWYHWDNVGNGVSVVSNSKCKLFKSTLAISKVYFYVLVSKIK